MKPWLKRSLIATATLIALSVGGGTWFVQQRLPQRSGEVAVTGLKAPVTVRYDEAGVPHIQAQNEADLYRTLGWVHAQDRLFQMEMMRRLSRGELAEVLGPKLLPTDKLMRTLTLRDEADKRAAMLDGNAPSTQALQAYLDGVNAFQDSHPAPLEFALLGIPKRPFTTADTLSVAGYLAYSFASAFRTGPVLTQIRDELGPEYLKAFDLAWAPDGAVAEGERQATAAGLPPLSPSAQPGAQPAAKPAKAALLQAADKHTLAALGQLSDSALALAQVPLFEGSNAWVVAGSRSASGKPILAGDPHISFAAPAVWYEAHLQSPGFELYGHFGALNPMALLGLNSQFGWSLTMFQNDDIDLVAETINPANPKQVMVGGQWVELTERTETIQVKGQAPVTLTLRRSPHGPIISDALTTGREQPRPIAMWWTQLVAPNPAVEAFYQLNRADTLAKARQAVEGIHAPGLNVVWANTQGDIAWWAAAKLPQRPAGVNPAFVLDGSKPEADKLGFHPFSSNPQDENPARGYIVSANHQPAAATPAPGYYNLWDRALRLDRQLRDPTQRWTAATTHALQLDTETTYAQRVLKPLLPRLNELVKAPEEQALLQQLAQWPGRYDMELTAPTIFQQFLYELAREAMADELGGDSKDGAPPTPFSNLRRTKALDHALPRLAADANSPWWDKRDTSAKETRDDVLKAAWAATLQHLRTTFGKDPAQWTWGRAHTLTHGHPLGQQKPLDKLFNVGPLPVPGGREVPNNYSGPLGPAPWAVAYGPSTRRVIDFAVPHKAQGGNPVGQSGVWPDRHYRDQAEGHARGETRPQWLAEEDVARQTASTLKLVPGK